MYMCDGVPGETHVDWEGLASEGTHPLGLPVMWWLHLVALNVWILTCCRFGIFRKTFPSKMVSFFFKNKQTKKEESKSTYSTLERDVKKTVDISLNLHKNRNSGRTNQKLMKWSPACSSVLTGAHSCFTHSENEPGCGGPQMDHQPCGTDVTVTAAQGGRQKLWK